MTFSSSDLAFTRRQAGLSASVSAPVTASGDDGRFKFCTRLIPGNYVVLVTPPASVDCQVFSEQRQIETSSDEDSGDVLTLRTPARLKGTITSTTATPVENATIEVVALGLDQGVALAHDDLAVPTNNRSRQTSTDEKGVFQLSVDIGAYDLIVKPPSQSGYAWLQSRVNVGPSVEQPLTTMLALAPPTLVEGKLRYENNQAQQTLAGAEVHAYTIVERRDEQAARAVEIGRTQASEDGTIMLLIAPEGPDAF